MSSKFIFIFLFTAVAGMQQIFALQESPSFDGVREIISFELQGHQRTSKDWLQTYLGLKLPMPIDADLIKAWHTKLLTSGVFEDVKILTRPITGSDGYKLTIELVEKWTLIPVIKGDLGGGVPVQTYGVFDMHSFGSLWTLGALAKKYGDARYGYSFFVRAPRWLNGSNYLALDFYRNFRIRSLYDQKFDETHQLLQDQSKIRLAFLKAFYLFEKPIQLGFNILLTQQKPIEFLKGVDNGVFQLQKNRYQQYWLLPTLVYDDVSIYQLNSDGLRLSLKGGPIFTEDEHKSVVELEAFYYKFFENDFGLASHFFTGSYTGEGYEQLYFLGGLDSIRGVPDSFLVGKKAMFANLELLKTFMKKSYLWGQGVVFVDGGAAASKCSEVLKDVVTTFGVGIRLSTPKVSRLTFRIDYAWLADDPSTHGISIGLNSFFDPYKPLE